MNRRGAEIAERREETGLTYSLAEGEAEAGRYVSWGLKALGLECAAAEVTYLDAGIMNYVYRVELPGRTLFLKQALERVKQHDRLGPDLAGVSPARIAAEYRALALLASELDETHRSAIPRPLWFDEASNVLWTEEVLPGARSLHGELVDGRCSSEAARKIGRLLGAIHGAQTGRVPPLWPDEAADRGNWLRFLRMRTTGLLERAALPSEAEAVTNALYTEARRRERSGMVSHLDLAPKNALVSAGGEVAVLDFELGAAVSDPAYDAGFLIGHYLLMGANRPGLAQEAAHAGAAAAEGYLETAPEVDAGWGERVGRYAGLTMLYRVYGSSPAPYLAPERYGAIREQGLRLLLGGERILHG